MTLYECGYDEVSSTARTFPKFDLVKFSTDPLSS